MSDLCLLRWYLALFAASLSVGIGCLYGAHTSEPLMPWWSAILFTALSAFFVIFLGFSESPFIELPCLLTCSQSRPPPDSILRSRVLFRSLLRLCTPESLCQFLWLCPVYFNVLTGLLALSRTPICSGTAHLSRLSTCCKVYRPHDSTRAFS
jgi:hypothetical protein